MGLINTSTIENLSISVCEALKSNLPVFCFEVGGLQKLFKMIIRDIVVHPKILRY